MILNTVLCDFLAGFTLWLLKCATLFKKKKKGFEHIFLSWLRQQGDLMLYIIAEMGDLVLTAEVIWEQCLWIVAKDSKILTISYTCYLLCCSDASCRTPQNRMWEQQNSSCIWVLTLREIHHYQNPQIFNKYYSKISLAGILV